MRYLKLACLLPLCYLIFCGSFVLSGQTSGYQIKGALINANSESAYLAMLYGNNQYIVDTATIHQGSFIFEGPVKLESGVYLVILPPAQSFFILIDKDRPNMSFHADVEDIINTIEFQGSNDNQLYYTYSKFIDQRRKEMEVIKGKYDANQDSANKLVILDEMQKQKEQIATFQNDLIVSYPNSLTAAIVKCEITVEPPTFQGSPEKVQFAQYQFSKDHYFDYIDLTDERLIRAPETVLVSRVDKFLDELTYQHPDSLNSSIDFILKQAETAEVNYRYLLTHFFNKYRESKSMGMDAVYAHIATEYIAKDKTPWIKGEEKKMILDAVAKIEATLIGKKAPDFTVQLKDGEDLSLYEVNSPITVLFFWSPDCSHCQQSMPQLEDIYAIYSEKGVQFLTICTKLNEREKGCWEYLESINFSNWINTSDQVGGAALLHKKYNIRSTPKILILDENKIILAKDVGVEHLQEVLRRILEVNK